LIESGALPSVLRPARNDVNAILAWRDHYFIIYDFPLYK
jgi:hypothetical protein